MWMYHDGKVDQDIVSEIKSAYFCKTSFWFCFLSNRKQPFLGPELVPGADFAELSDSTPTCHRRGTI